MPGRKGVKRSVRTAKIDIEPEDLLHDNPIDIVRIPSQNIQFFESNENPTTESGDLVAPRKEIYYTKFNALEAKTINDAQVASTDLDEKFNPYIKTAAEDNELKNHKLEQTLKQKLKKEVNVSFQDKGKNFSTNSSLSNWQNWKKKIDEVISEMQKRNMLIRLADRSAGGWMTVQEYVSDELSSDSQDSKKNAAGGKQGNQKEKA